MLLLSRARLAGFGALPQNGECMKNLDAAEIASYQNIKFLPRQL